MPAAPKAVLVARVVLGGLFLYYGAYKIVHQVEFLKALRAYDVLPISPPEPMNLIAVALPWIEVTCGGLLLWGRWLRPTAGLVFVLTMVFTLAVTGRALAERGDTGASLCSVRFDCGCGQGPVLFCVKLAENAVLIALAVIIALRSRGSDRSTSGELAR